MPALLFAGLLSACSEPDAYGSVVRLAERQADRAPEQYAAIRRDLDHNARVYFADENATIVPYGRIASGGACGLADTRWGRYVVIYYSGLFHPYPIENDTVDPRDLSLCLLQNADDPIPPASDLMRLTEPGPSIAVGRGSPEEVQRDVLATEFARERSDSAYSAAERESQTD